MVVSLCRRLEWVGDYGGGGVCEAGRAAGRVKGGVGVGFVGMGGVCGRERMKEGGRGREGSLMQVLSCLSHISRIHPTQPTQHRNLQDGIHGCNRKFTRLFVSPSTLLSSQSRCLSTSLLFRSHLSTHPPPPLFSVQTGQVGRRRLFDQH